MKPPEDVSPSELWLKLTQSPRPTEVIDFPRRGPDGKPVGKVRIQVLRMEEHDRARLTAQKKLKERARYLGFDKLESADLEAPGVREVLGDMTARELLAMACLSEQSVTSDDDRPFYPRLFPDADGLGKELSADETAVLFNAYILVQNKYGPYERNLTEEGDLDAWMRRLEEGGSEFPLLSLSLPHLVALTSSSLARNCTLFRILASQWESLPDSLKSALESFSTAITSFGEQQQTSARSGLEGLGANELITVEQAIRVAQALKG